LITAMLRPSLLLALSAVVLRAEFTPGEILISEMNCVACHEASPEIATRLASRTAPRLGTDGVRVTPQWIREFLADPQTAKPGTLMPDMLHGVPAEEKAVMIEGLTHFLVSQQDEAAKADVGASAAKIETGRALYHDVGCVQCHTPFALPKGREDDDAAKAEFARLQAESVPLGGAAIAKKYTVGELAKFLRDPLKARPAGRMPSLKLDAGEAEAIAMFLLREQMPAGAAVSLPGLQYDYYEKEFPELPEFDRLTPTATGIAETPSLAQARRKNGFALRWRGNITLPKDGKYKFYVSSDDGARLYLDGKLLVDNGGIHPAQERTGEVELKKGAHTIALTYFDAGGNVAFDVKFKDADGNKGPLPTKLLSHDGQPMVPVGDSPFVVDQAKADVGAQFYAHLQCGKCHDNLQPARNTQTALANPPRKLAELKLRQPAGCIGAAPKPGHAKFALTARQRTVILAALQNQDVLGLALTPEQQVRRTMTTLNCYACHSRDKRGGPEGIRRDYLTTVGEIDLGDEGRVPPRLEGVGAKLQPAWMKTILAEGGAVRPYMATRMPLFGAANVAHLIEPFEKADALPDAREQLNNFTNGAADLAKHGRKLVGTGGLSCIACHNFAGNKSLGVPALDLASTGQRLKWDWFRRYLLDPQSLRPGTRMPPFFPGGVAVNKDVLKGDAEQQIAALWLYLARKNFTDLPAGLVQGKAEIVATDEAVIYRNFIEGGGPRAIGVGYPERANLCFDANELRIAMIWHGPFMDAAKHMNGRGAGFEKPLGTNVVKLAPGPAFAILADATSPWPVAGKVTASSGFLGYRLDEKQRPIFRYRIGDFTIEDHAVPAPGEVDAMFRRTFTVEGAGALHFRAAAGKISQDGESFTVDDKLRLKFPGAKPFIRGTGDKAELLVPLSFADGTARLVEEIVW
jgi:cbb3-type cytochrome oxidase cytochrome c subunit